MPRRCLTVRVGLRLRFLAVCGAEIDLPPLGAVTHRRVEMEPAIHAFARDGGGYRSAHFQTLLNIGVKRKKINGNSMHDRTIHILSKNVYSYYMAIIKAYGASTRSDLDRKCQTRTIARVSRWQPAPTIARFSIVMISSVNSLILKKDSVTKHVLCAFEYLTSGRTESLSFFWQEK